MSRYVVQVEYQTKGGAPGAFSDAIEAPDVDTAYQAAVKLCKRRRRPARINGGSATLYLADVSRA